MSEFLVGLIITCILVYVALSTYAPEALSSIIRFVFVFLGG